MVRHATGPQAVRVELFAHNVSRSSSPNSSYVGRRPECASPSRRILRTPSAAGFEEHLPGALAPNSGQEAQQELVARERAVGHLVERDGVGQLAGAVELQPVGEQEQTNLRPGDGVVGVGDGV